MDSLCPCLLRFECQQWLTGQTGKTKATRAREGIIWLMKLQHAYKRLVTLIG